MSPKGEVVGYRPIRPGKLSLEAVRAQVSEFTPRSESTVTAKLSKGPDLGLDKLSPENEERRRLILEDEMAREKHRELAIASESDTTPATDRLTIEERDR